MSISASTLPLQTTSTIGTCRLCSARSQTWTGEAPTCAFTVHRPISLIKDSERRGSYEASGTRTFRPFQPANSDCATLIALRDYAYALAQRATTFGEQLGYQHFQDDAYGTSFATLVGRPDCIRGVLVLTWSSDTSATGSAVVMRDAEAPHVPDIEECERFLVAAYKTAILAHVPTDVDAPGNCIAEYPALLKTARVIVPPSSTPS